MQAKRGGRISLRLELDQGSEPIRGHLVAANGTAEEFIGWLGLAAVIERLGLSEQPEVRGVS